MNIPLAFFRFLPRGMAALLLAVSVARAHFSILIHDAEPGASSGVVTVTVASGHPVEVEFEAAPWPTRPWALDARGHSTNLTAALEPVLFRSDSAAAA